MGLDKLEEALLRQRQDFAETEVVSIIAKIFDIEEPTVVRILGAFMFMLHEAPMMEVPFVDDPPWRAIEALLEEDVYAGIEVAVRTALARARIARHINQDEPLNVDIAALLGNDATRVCEGCPHRLLCIAETLSTPERCRRFRVVPVTVLSLQGTTARVAAEHPKGEYTLNILELPYRTFYTKTANPTE